MECTGTVLYYVMKKENDYFFTVEIRKYFIIRGNQ